MVRNPVGGAVVAAVMICLAAGAWSGFRASAFDPPPAAPAQGPKPPDEGRLYVWSSPDQGPQSLLVLSVADDGTAEACYLVPARVRLAPRAAGAKPLARADLERMLVGHLLTANMGGRGKDGVPVADFWMGKEAGGWLSAAAPPAAGK